MLQSLREVAPQGQVSEAWEDHALQALVEASHALFRS